MGVSRTPVVQALDRLAREALLETLPNGRVVVAGISEAAAREMLEIRTALEAYAGRLAAERGLGAETLDRLRDLNRAMRDEIARLPELDGGRRARGVERVIGLNQELHQIINAASGNERLVRLLEETLDLAATLPVLLSLSDEELQVAVDQHDAIIGFLARQDADATERAVREHVQASLVGALPRLACRVPQPAG